MQALADDPHVDLNDPTADEALAWAAECDCPLHPAYTYVWHDITVKSFVELADAVADASVQSDANGLDADQSDSVLVIDRTESVRATLETLLVSHHQTETTLEVGDWQPLARSLGLDDERNRTWDQLSAEANGFDGGDNAIKAANEVAPFEIRERAPTRIGARMGRPEKSEKRDLSPAVHTLFPITEAGGNQRDVAKAAGTMDDQGQRGIHDVRISQRQCPDCGTETFESQCPDCGGHTERHYECEDCEVTCEPDESGRVECPKCGQEVTAAGWTAVDLQAEYRDALDTINEREGNFQILKGVQGLMSADKTPEAMEKGVLRAKHGVSAFKDGTVRYDMTDLPVTAVKPEELDVTADHFRGLGYETDIDGDPLRHDDQLVELKVQDVVLSEGAAEHMRRTADFVDDLLERFYGLPAFYDIEERDDLVGELVFGMAPHTSAAVVGRVIGFTEAAVGYAHPYFHASKRRNCDGDEDCVMLLMDGLLNFSRQFLPDKRGGRMDAPLVMSSRVDPTEIDDEAHNMDIVSSYPREFYEATREMADPEAIDIRTGEDTLDTVDQYHGFEHTHDSTSIHMGPSLSAYKTLDSMMDKMDAQLELARKLRAVDETDVAERVIEYHFLPDLIGNLRAFSRQETRCLDCGESYRRMPLSGDCRECGGRVNLTVHEGQLTSTWIRPSRSPSGSAAGSTPNSDCEFSNGRWNPSSRTTRTNRAALPTSCSPRGQSTAAAARSRQLPTASPSLASGITSVS
ncbi:MAG: DNA polymerase, archaeal type II, large subunit [Halonotius sp. J07HN6]|nr:MAG: DNA polymerase, archaeal type II, large subunit [Halonotius sp. J07HN6]